MPSFTDDDGDMKALRAHSLQIEAMQCANKSFDLRSDESVWFGSREPLNATDRNDTEFRSLQAALFKIHFDRNGNEDEAMFRKTASPNLRQIKTKTPTSQTLQVPKQLRFSIPGPDFTPDTFTFCSLPQHKERRAASRRAGNKQLEEVNKEYERVYQENLMELEYGPSCECNRYPWQHELHPSGTVKRNAERSQQSGDVEMAERDRVEA